MAFTDVISQPPYPGAKKEEIAELFVGDLSYSDWQTIFVQHRWMDAWPIFRFTAAERFDPQTDKPKLWETVQVKPGNLVAIKLGGEIAITGYVTTRQTAYDANSHAVSIQGVGVQWRVWRGSILDKSQEFQGDYKAVVTQVLKPFGVTPKFLGEISSEPFDGGAHNEIGDSVFQFLERLGRTRKVILAADYLGNLVFVGEHVSEIIDDLTEGENIKSCQCVIKIEEQYNLYVARGQVKRSDDSSPSKAAQQEAMVRGTLPFYSPILVPMEQPVKKQVELDLRAQFEANLGEGSIIEATVIVYGWFTRSGLLWAQFCGQSVTLNLPMTGLPVGTKLAIRSVTCTQDSQSGTQTTLDLVAGWLLNDKGIVQATAPVPPAPSTATSTPAQPAVTGDPQAGPG
jgi:prophage tail gpP-like protein